jgi:hypothetical protein
VISHSVGRAPPGSARARRAAGGCSWPARPAAVLCASSSRTHGKTPPHLRRAGPLADIFLRVVRTRARPPQVTEALRRYPYDSPPGLPQVALFLGTGRRCEPDLASGPEPRRCLVAISCQLERCWRGFLGWRVLTADRSSPSSISWRIASERDRASSQAFIHSSMRSMSSCGRRTAITGCCPVAGRPLFLRITRIDFTISA